MKSYFCHSSFASTKNHPVQNDLTRFILIHLFFWVVLAQVTAALLLWPLGFGSPEDFAVILEEMKQGRHLDMAVPFKLLALATNLVGLFFPVLIFVALFRQGRLADFLHLNRLPALRPMGWGVAGFLSLLPFVQFLYALGRQLFAQMGDDTERLGALLHIDGPADLAFTVLVLGLAPAIFEEFLYRGAFQRLTMERFPGSWLGIWLTALLFSAAHFDVAGFLPRFVLGAAFGWLVWGTGSLWISMGLHALFNTAQIVLMYYQGPPAAGASPWEGVVWWVVLSSAMLSAYCWWRFFRETGKGEDATGH